MLQRNESHESWSDCRVVLCFGTSERLLYWKRWKLCPRKICLVKTCLHRQKVAEPIPPYTIEKWSATNYSSLDLKIHSFTFLMELWNGEQLRELLALTSSAAVAFSRSARLLLLFLFVYMGCFHSVSIAMYHVTNQCNHNRRMLPKRLPNNLVPQKLTRANKERNTGYRVIFGHFSSCEKRTELCLAFPFSLRLSFGAEFGLVRPYARWKHGGEDGWRGRVECQRSGSRFFGYISWSGPKSGAVMQWFGCSHMVVELAGHIVLVQHGSAKSHLRMGNDQQMIHVFSNDDFNALVSSTVLALLFFPPWPPFSFGNRQGNSLMLWANCWVDL